MADQLINLLRPSPSLKWQRIAVKKKKSREKAFVVCIPEEGPSLKLESCMWKM